MLPSCGLLTTMSPDYSPRQGMIELRHLSSIGPRATSSPMKSDGDFSPLILKNYPDDDEDRDRHSSKDHDRPFSRVSPYNSEISLCLLLVLLFAGLISAFSIVNHWVSPLVSCHF